MLRYFKIISKSWTKSELQLPMVNNNKLDLSSAYTVSFNWKQNCVGQQIHVLLIATNIRANKTSLWLVDVMKNICTSHVSNSALTRFIRAYVQFYLRSAGVGYLIIRVFSGVENSITTLGVEIFNVKSWFILHCLSASREGRGEWKDLIDTLSPWYACSL